MEMQRRTGDCDFPKTTIRPTTIMLRYRVLIFAIIFIKCATSNTTNSIREDVEHNDNTEHTTGISSETKSNTKLGIVTGEEEYQLASHIKLHDTTKFFVVYHVVTCDGYILDIFRMKSHIKVTRPTKKYPVLFLHGMLQSSDRFVEQGRANGIAFKLQDLGYDVWLANARGNKYSRLHLYLEPDLYREKYRFFNYSYEEIGLYDLPAIVDYILEETQSEKLHYIGHSQGGTAFLVLNSLLPKYNAKFVGAHLLAPLGYQEHFSNEKIKTIAALGETVYEMLLKLGILEVFPYDSKTKNHPHYESVDHCLGDIKYRDICRELHVDKHMALNTVKFNNLDTQGGAIKQLAHFAQNIVSKTFRRWDFGPGGNKEHYGMLEPPVFDLKLVTAPTIIHYAPNDEVVDARDILAMANDMSNAKVRKVGRSDFTHVDFMDSPDVMECVFDNVIDDLQNLDDGKDVQGSSTKLSQSLLLYMLPMLVTVLNNELKS